MASGGGRKISYQDLVKVQNRIERCLLHYMNKKEAMNSLACHGVNPGVTDLVWTRLEEENPEFFNAYHLKILVKQQIMEFNRLLSEQKELMCQTELSGITSVPLSNGSDISPTNQSSTCCIANITRPLEKATMQQIKPSSVPNAFSCGASIQSCAQGTVNVSNQGGMINVSPTILLSQNSNVAQALNGKIAKPEASYAGNFPFNFSPHNNFLGSYPLISNGNVSPFSSIESNAQPLNGSVLDGDAYSFGFLEQIPQNFGLPEFTADFSGSSDLLASYARAPFPSTDANNFVDLHGNMDRLHAVSEALRYRSYGGN